MKTGTDWSDLSAWDIMISRVNLKLKDFGTKNTGWNLQIALNMNHFQKYCLSSTKLVLEVTFRGRETRIGDTFWLDTSPSFCTTNSADTLARSCSCLANLGCFVVPNSLLTFSRTVNFINQRLKNPHQTLPKPRGFHGISEDSTSGKFHPMRWRLQEKVSPASQWNTQNHGFRQFRMCVCVRV